MGVEKVNSSGGEEDVELVTATDEEVAAIVAGEMRGSERRWAEGTALMMAGTEARIIAAINARPKPVSKPGGPYGFERDGGSGGCRIYNNTGETMVKVYGGKGVDVEETTKRIVAMYNGEE